MLSETQAVKRTVARYKRKKWELRETSKRPLGREKRHSRRNPWYNGGGRSKRLGWEAGQLIILSIEPRLKVGYIYTDHNTEKRLKRRIGKKLSQPFRRKKRGPKRRRSAGKNNVRPNRASRR